MAQKGQKLTLGLAQDSKEVRDQKADSVELSNQE